MAVIAAAAAAAAAGELLRRRLSTGWFAPAHTVIVVTGLTGFLIGWTLVIAAWT